MANDRTCFEPADIIQRMKETIRNGKNGRDYTFLPSDKNRAFTEKYLIDEHKRKEILLSLEPSDYVGSEYSINRNFENDIVHKFVKKVHLLPLRTDAFDFEQVDVYIKFTWPNGQRILVVISFHLSGDYDMED